MTESALEANSAKRGRIERIRAAAVIGNNIAALRQVEVLRGLSDEALERFAGSCQWHCFTAKKEVLSADDTSADVYFILSGTLRASLYAANGRSVVLRTLSAGDIFGELAALDGAPRSATIEAVEYCELAWMPARDFQKFLKEEPEFSLALLKRLASQLRGLSDRIFEFSTLAVRHRIHAELLRLATKGKSSGNEAFLSPAPMLKDLAASVSTHREAVSRELNRLKTNGILKRERRGLRILDVNRLEVLVNLARDDNSAA